MFYLKNSCLSLICVFVISCMGNRNIPIVYTKNKKYKYEALFIKADGDTLTKEYIFITSKGRPWFFDRSQIAYKVNYEPDTLGLKEFTNPVNQKQLFYDFAKQRSESKGRPFYGVLDHVERSGAIEESDFFWIHPFRKNQYVYTEVAPFPQIEKNYLVKGEIWRDTILILSGWDNFIGTCASEYLVQGNCNYSSGAVNLENCWQISSVSNHSLLGKSYLNYIYNSSFGIVEMKYEFYDGVKIEINLIEVIYND